MYAYLSLFQPRTRRFRGKLGILLLLSAAGIPAVSLRGNAGEPPADSPPASPKDRPAAAPAEFKPIPFRAGTITRVQVTRKAILWRDLNKMLAAGLFVPSDEDDDSTLARRPPEDGNEYVILTLRLRPGHSIGKADWNLVYGADAFPCLAISRDRLPYDARVWQYVYQDGNAQIHLLFEVPEHIEQVKLVSALPLTIPPPEITIPLLSGKTRTLAEPPSPRPPAASEKHTPPPSKIKPAQSKTPPVPGTE